MDLATKIVLLAAFAQRLIFVGACELFAMESLGALKLSPFNGSDKCCSALTAAFAYDIAKNRVQQWTGMPWSNAVTVIGIDTCTATDWGNCASDPVHIADDETFQKVASYICNNWDTGCNIDSLVGTDVVKPFVPLMQAAITKETMCAGPVTSGTTTTTVAATTTTMSATTRTAVDLDAANSNSQVLLPLLLSGLLALKA